MYEAITVPSCVWLQMKTEDPSPTHYSLTGRRAKSSGGGSCSYLYFWRMDGTVAGGRPRVRDRDPEGEMGREKGEGRRERGRGGRK